jgi:hypothetical protein
MVIWVCVRIEVRQLAQRLRHRHCLLVHRQAGATFRQQDGVDEFIGRRGRASSNTTAQDQISSSATRVVCSSGSGTTKSTATCDLRRY